MPVSPFLADVIFASSRLFPGCLSLVGGIDRVGDSIHVKIAGACRQSPEQGLWPEPREDRDTHQKGGSGRLLFDA